MLRIRQEVPADVDRIRQVNTAAFGQTNEARLVDALREVAAPFISLVAVDEGEIVGHICFTPVEVDSQTERPVTLAGLAPMAVVPARQRQGVGAKLVEAGLEECRRAGFGAVVVLGHPEYYPRFGFEAAVSKGLSSEYHVPDPVFMVVELVSNAVAGIRGVVRYQRVFGNFE